MEALARKARMAIARDLDLATSVSRLRKQMRDGREGSPEGSAVLARELARHPSLFRVVDPWRGPWRTVPGRDRATRGRLDTRPESGNRAERAETTGRGDASPFDEMPMIVPVDVEWADGEACLARRLRESVYRIGRSVDEHSAVSIARWARLVRAAAAAQRRLGRPTGPPPDLPAGPALGSVSAKGPTREAP